MPSRALLHRALGAALAVTLAAVPPSARGADAQSPRASGISTGGAPRAGATTLVVLGVEHSAQLVSRVYHPGYLRAFLDRVQPTALCIERAPEEFARGDHYEFTYEIQHVTVPYARRHGVALCPVDWLPSRDDERLAFGRLEVVELPAVRAPSGFQGFLTLDSASLQRTLFYADAEQSRAEVRAFYDRPRTAGWPDFPRRLGLYRTFMQAMRIRAATREHAGGTVLVVVGSMHKEDIEHVLGGDPGLRIVQPSAYGLPTVAEADAQLLEHDLAAILSFNLLGVQSTESAVDWSWVAATLEQFARVSPSAPELPLLRMRHAVLTQQRPPAAAAAAYERIAQALDSTARFVFTGVEDARRVDSYFDPFGNLGVRQRALVEAAREWVRAGQPTQAERLRAELLRAGSWSPLRRAQLGLYWERYITNVDRR